jgi:group I intron endonuclease
MKYLRLPGIYKITNLVNGKGYVGKSQDIFTRWVNHYRYAKRLHDGKKPTRGTGAIYLAMNKYGIENFKFEMLFIFPLNIEITDSMLNTFEVFFIADQNTYAHDGHGYNLTKGGDGISGHIHSVATKNRIGKAHRGVAKSEVSKIKNRLAHLGKVTSEETKAKLREANKGKNNGMFGKIHSEESKDKNRLSHLGKEKPIDFYRKHSRPVLSLATGELFKTENHLANLLSKTRSYIHHKIGKNIPIDGIAYRYITWEEFDKLNSANPN